MRNVANRAGSLPRRTEPRPSPTSAATGDRAPPTSAGRRHAPRRPHPAAPPQPTRPGRIARWFGRKPRRPAPSAHPPLPDSDNAPFTPETWPGLSPEACAILNTPVEECDPEILRLVLSIFAQHLANTPALGLTDPNALFATLCQRLGAPPGDMPDTAPPEAPDEAPATGMQEAPDEAPATGMQEAPDAPPVSPHARPEPRQDGLPDRPATAARAVSAARAASEAAPLAAVPPQPRRHRSRAPRHGRRRLLFGRPGVFSRLLGALPPGLSPRRLCYAACAGPP